MIYHIRQASTTAILPLRQRILRKEFTLEESRFDGDDAETTIHLALYIEGKIKAVVSLMNEISPHHNSNNQYRLRGMAVAEGEQGRGLGRALFEESLQVLAAKNISYMWFHARVNALGFYETLGCHKVGEMFSIPTAGSHYFMYRELTPNKYRKPIL